MLPEKFRDYITLDKGYEYVNYAKKYIEKTVGRKIRIKTNTQRDEIINNAIISTSNFAIKSGEKNPNNRERYFYVAIKNKMLYTKNSKNEKTLYIDDIIVTRSGSDGVENNNFLDELAQDEQEMFELEENVHPKLTLDDIDSRAKQQVLLGTTQPINYSIRRLRFVLGVSINEIVDHLQYSRTFVRVRSNQLNDLIKANFKERYDNIY